VEHLFLQLGCLLGQLATLQHAHLFTCKERRKIAEISRQYVHPWTPERVWVSLLGKQVRTDKAVMDR
jgi:hypothetical protein